jgi:hypothetical protein
MKCVLAGVCDMDFQAGRDRIDGAKLHYLGIDPSTKGQTANNQFVPRHILEHSNVKRGEIEDLVGTEMNIDFNDKGKIIGIMV